MTPAGPLRRLAWALLLTLTATVLVFAFELAAYTPYPPDRAGGPEPGPWPARYLDWLAALARLEFLQDAQRRDVLLAVVRVPYAVSLTMAVAFSALIVAGVVMAAGIDAEDGRPARPVRPGWVAGAVAVLALLGWLAGTLGTAAGLLGRLVGADVLPSTVHVPFLAPADSGLGHGLEQLHQLVFPTLVVTLAVVPLAGWWCRRTGTGPPVVALTRGVRTVTNLLPAFVAAAVLVELARNSFGTSQHLVGRNIAQWFDDPTADIATTVLLLGTTIAVIRLGLDIVAGVAAVPDDEPPPASAPTSGQAQAPESFGELWERVRSARGGWWSLAVLGLLVCYARLWFDVGPTDIVSSEAPVPPSAAHWLGVDTLGHDQLTRLAAATTGTVLVVVGAATVATLAGLLITAVALRRRAAPAVATAVPTAARVASAVAAVAAFGAVFWLLANFDDPSQPYSVPGTRRLELALVIGVLLVPLTTRLLVGRAARSVRPGPVGVGGTWLAACAAAVVVEQLATLLVVKLDHRSPTLGAVLAETVAGSDIANLGLSLVDPTTDQPWLWFPPAVVVVVLAVSTTLLATSVLTGPLTPRERVRAGRRARSG